MNYGVFIIYHSYFIIRLKTFISHHSSLLKMTKRYPGVRPFETEDKDLFFGRESDIKDLSDLIALERLVVLFGKSGYGKSSLINAGIMPHLGQLDDADDTPLLPLTIRLGSFTDGSASPIETILAKLNERDATQQAKYAPTEVSSFLDTLLPEQPLWYHFKQRQTDDKRRFILIFDQFEEFFTYPLAQQVAFKSQLAELLYQDTPQIVREAAPTLSKDQRRLLVNPLEIKVLFAIRADRMSFLDSMKDKLPAILQKRYELKGLTEEQAKEAIQKPAQAPQPPEGETTRSAKSSPGEGKLTLFTTQRETTRSAASFPFGGGGGFASQPFTYTDNALRVMTQKLSETKVSQRSGIEAFQLQILCEYLEDKIIKGEIPNNRIEPAYFEDKIDEIYEGYYQRLIDKLDPSVRTAAQLLIEEDLIYHNEKTGDSRRESRDSGRLLDKDGITQELLDALESNFLLRREVNSLGGIGYEVSHDTLIAPILKSKKERNAIEEQERLKIEEDEKEIERLRLADEAEKEKSRNKELQKALTNAKNSRHLLFLALVAMTWLTYESRKQKSIALEEKAKAEKSLKDYLEAQKAKEMTEFKIDLNKIKQVLQGGNCPTPEQLQKMQDMKTKYQTDSDLRDQIDRIPLGNCR